MKKLLITLVILISLAGYYWYTELKNPVLSVGSTVTTILGTDKISDSRTTINDNFASLNSGKMEVSTTTLPLVTTMSNLTTVGALKSGSLTTGFTAINVAQGGTGRASLNVNQVLLGNGTSGIDKVSGLGTSGQFLTSNGAGSAPTWQTSAVDTGIAYNWTGEHTFTASSSMLSLNLTDLMATVATTTTLYNTNLTSSGTQTLNGIAYTFPVSDGSNLYVLSTDSSGGLTWVEDDVSIDTCSGTITMPANNSSGTEYGACSFTVKKLDIIVDGDGHDGWWTWISGKQLIFYDKSSDAEVTTSNLDWDSGVDSSSVYSIGTATSTGFSMTYVNNATYGGGGATINYIGTR